MKKTGDNIPVRLCLMTVHAHPDDESSKGACTVALYSKKNIKTVLVCCTGGEEGDILNPEMDLPEVKENLADIRSNELANATKVIGYDEVFKLGYRDSGMPGSEANSNPDSFVQADFDEAVGRLVKIIREVRPQVIVTYGADQKGYPHPDHIKTHEISKAAFFAAPDPNKYTDAGDPFKPLRLFYTVWSKERFLLVHQKFLELGLESPFDQKWFDRIDNQDEDERPTTSVDVCSVASVRRLALLEHKTQIDPKSKFWFGLPDDVMDSIYPYDDYHLAEDLSKTKKLPKDDLFEGLYS
jgi:mycothiol S-conjugate amidase